jgi:hypothetical protein
MQLVKTFPAFYGTRKFITTFTVALHWSLSWATAVKSIPQHRLLDPFKYYLPTYVLVFVVVSFPWLRTNELRVVLCYPIGATCLAHLILIDLIIVIILAKSSSYEASHYAAFSNVPSPFPSLVQIFSSASCSQTLLVCVPPIRHQISHPYRTTVEYNLIYIYSNFYVFRQVTRRRKVLYWMVASISRIFSWIKFWSVTVVPRYLNCTTFWNDLAAVFMIWSCPAFWCWESDIYLAFFAFTSRPTFISSIN